MMDLKQGVWSGLIGRWIGSTGGHFCEHGNEPLGLKNCCKHLFYYNAKKILYIEIGGFFLVCNVLISTLLIKMVKTIITVFFLL
jgi:hypothetical protein